MVDAQAAEEEVLHWPAFAFLNTTLHTTHCTLLTTHYLLLTTHYTLCTAHYTLHTTHYTLHTTHYTLSLSTGGGVVDAQAAEEEVLHWPASALMVEGLGFRDWGVGLRVEGVGFRVKGVGCGFRV